MAMMSMALGESPRLLSVALLTRSFSPRFLKPQPPPDLSIPTYPCHDHDLSACHFVNYIHSLSIHPSGRCPLELVLAFIASYSHPHQPRRLQLICRDTCHFTTRTHHTAHLPHCTCSVVPASLVISSFHLSIHHSPRPGIPPLPSYTPSAHHPITPSHHQDGRVKGTAHPALNLCPSLDLSAPASLLNPIPRIKSKPSFSTLTSPLSSPSSKPPAMAPFTVPKSAFLMPSS